MNWKNISKVAFFLVAASFFSVFSYAETAWIDVRTAVEHKIDHIEGDIRISHGDIVEKVTELYPNKDTDISLYCRSGNRAGKAKSALEEAGYTQVTNAGSIDDARKIRSIED